MSYSPQVGDQIRFSRPRRNYDTTSTYTVSEVDANDATLKATDPATGQQGTWVRWSEVQPAAAIGWDYLQRHLPSEALKLLAAFEGVQNLQLRADVKDAVLVQLPDLKERILATVNELSARNALDEVSANPLFAAADTDAHDRLDAPQSQTAAAESPSTDSSLVVRASDNREPKRRNGV